MSSISGRERDAQTRLDDVLVVVDHAHRKREQIGCAAFELHPVAIAVRMHAEAEGHLVKEARSGEGFGNVERARRRKRSAVRRCDRQVGPRHDRADRIDDPLRGRVQRGSIAEGARSVLKLERRATDLAEGQHEFDVTRVFLSGGIEVATMREGRGEAAV